ncbi:MAG: transglycosylase SLT domain-containing protein [Hydrogenophaga sp.]
MIGLRKGLLIAAWAAVMPCAIAQSPERLSLADHKPLAIPEEGADVAALVQRGQEALMGLEFSAAAQDYCSAARMGSADAQYRLARLLLQQRGLRRSHEQARFLMRMAAGQDHPAAKLYLQEINSLKSDPDLRPECIPEPPPPRPLYGTGWLPPSYDLAAEPITSAELKRYISKLDQERQTWAKLVQERAPHYGVDPGLALSVVRAESNFDPRALSPANAQGLMQLIPATAQRFGVVDPLDPAQNIEGGLAYLRWLLKRFDHDVIKTTAAYNAGEGAVDRYKGVPPYPETQAYVERILRFYRSAVHKAPPPPKVKRTRTTKTPPRG